MKTLYFTGVLRSGDGVKKDKSDLSVTSNDSLSDHHLQQNTSYLSSNRKSNERPEGNMHIPGFKCSHIDTEQLVTARNILQTTSGTIFCCKVTHFIVVHGQHILRCSGNKFVCSTLL